MPSAFTTPPMKRQFGKIRRFSRTANYKIFFPLNMASNDDDRRQRRKQGGVVGAAASKTRVPPKARCGCWVPQPDKRRAFKIVFTSPAPPAAHTAALRRRRGHTLYALQGAAVVLAR